VKFSHGAYVKKKALGHGISVSVKPGPGGKKTRRPRIYDSDVDDGADEDLQVNLGNLLIIQEKVKPDVPNDNELGGSIIFQFHTPTKIKSIGLVDIDERRRTVLKIFHSNMRPSRIVPRPIANGAFTTVQVRKSKVDKLVVKFPGSAGISFIKLCVENNTDK